MTDQEEVIRHALAEISSCPDGEEYLTHLLILACEDFNKGCLDLPSIQSTLSTCSGERIRLVMSSVAASLAYIRMLGILGPALDENGLDWD